MFRKVRRRDDLDVAAARPHLVALFAVPAPLQHVPPATFSRGRRVEHLRRRRSRFPPWRLVYAFPAHVFATAYLSCPRKLVSRH